MYYIVMCTCHKWLVYLQSYWSLKGPYCHWHVLFAQRSLPNSINGYGEEADHGFLASCAGSTCFSTSLHLQPSASPLSPLLPAWVLRHQLVDSTVFGLSRGHGEGAILCQLLGVVRHHLLSIVVPRQLRWRGTRHLHLEQNTLSLLDTSVLRELQYDRS